jgi:dihydrofolate reductase
MATSSEGRKIVVTEFITLDGIMEAPEKWSFAYYGDGIAQFKRAELFATGALLLGRRTYETFAGAWPKRKDSEGFADRMNALPKHVVSSTLRELSWDNSRLLKQPLPEGVANLKRETEQDIVVHGSRTLVNSLVQLDLVDEFHLLPSAPSTGQTFVVAGKEHMWGAPHWRSSASSR